VVLVIVGAPGIVAGVTVCGVDPVPLPTALIARTRTW
jgi:hypothetical protein